MIRQSFQILSILLILHSVGTAVRAQDTSSEQSIERDAIEQAMQRATGSLRGRITWPGRTVEHATIQVFRDSSLNQLYTEGVLRGDQGVFEVSVEPGVYYLVAFVDSNNSGDFDSGDGMGIYGITDWNDRAQNRKSVDVQDQQILEDLQIRISSVMARIDGTQQVIALNDPILKQMRGGFSLNLQKLFTGIRGKLEWPDHAIEKALIFAYTDLSWKYRSGHAIVGPDGSFELKLPPGKYYLLGLIDSNDSGAFDVGDPFGIYGVSELGLGELPNPILVEPNRFTEDIAIPIVGERPAKAPEPVDGTASTVVRGTVTWPGHAVENAEVQVYRDATLTREIARIAVEADGSFQALLPPGEYYLLANVDKDGDSAYSPGDAIGGYGTADIAGMPPQPFVVGAETVAEMEIEISARYDSSGQLYSAHSLEGDLPPAPLDLVGSGISGRILWEDQSLQNLILLVSDTPDFGSSQVLMMQLGEDNRYAWPISPGSYYLMAVVDTNGNRLADAEDGVGMYGTRNPVSGKPQRIGVFADHVTPYLDIEIHAVYTDMQGSIARIEDAHRSEIRQQYGAPEDLYQWTRFGKVIQEWWYWDQGISFIFESVGLGWKLTETKRFDPNAEEDAPAVEPAEDGEDVVDGTVYYSYDEVIWGLAPHGYQEPLAMGTHPTADSRKEKVAILDIEGNVRILDGVNTDGEVVVGRNMSPSEPVLSPDGQYVVYVRRMTDVTQLHVLHLASMQHQPIPTAFRECSTPVWSTDSKRIAYAASGSVDQPSTELGGPRNLYVYDTETQRIEPLSVGPDDDAEPAWSPVNTRILVFSRADGQHRQLWKVVLGDGGPPVLTRLTQFGGSQPVWMPDGEMVLYENSGQLWMLPVDGEQPPEPLMVHNQVVMGSTPAIVK